MNLPELERHLLSPPVFLSALLLYFGLAILCVKGSRRLLPPPQSRIARWSAVEVVLIVYVVMLLIGPSCMLLVTSGGLGKLFYGEEMIALARETGPDAELARGRLALPAKLIAFPLQVLATLGLLWAVSRTRPADLGLTTERAGKNVALGFLFWIMLTPVVLAIHAGAALLYETLTDAQPQSHPFEVLTLKGALTDLEMGLIVFLAMVVAPVIEELLFRGVLMGWLTRRVRASDVVTVLCLLLAMAHDVEGWAALPERNLARFLEVFSPSLFVILMLFGFVAVCHFQTTPFPAALYSSSLLFAIVHVFAWPSPVPLFVLALGLGWLAGRTQSLVGPIVLHSLFNGVACIQLLMGR